MCITVAYFQFQHIVTLWQVHYAQGVFALRYLNPLVAQSFYSVGELLLTGFQYIEVRQFQFQRHHVRRHRDLAVNAV